MWGYVHVSDDCKVFLGNLDRHAEPKAIAAWVRKVCKVELAISCKVVIRGRSCIRRGLDALTTGGGPPPIGDAPLTGGLVPHIVFRKRAQLVALQTRRGEPPRSSRLQHSNCGSPIYRFSTSSCPSGWGKTAVSDGYMCQSVSLPPPEPRGHFRWGLDVGWSTKVPGCLVGRRSDGRAGGRPGITGGQGPRGGVDRVCRVGRVGRVGRGPMV